MHGLYIFTETVRFLTLFSMQGYFGEFGVISW